MFYYSFGTQDSELKISIHFLNWMEKFRRWRNENV